eukprot:1465566-Alexandrium_andersonii.AAC.1
MTGPTVSAKRAPVSLLKQVGICSSRYWDANSSDRILGAQMRTSTEDPRSSSYSGRTAQAHASR